MRTEPWNGEGNGNLEALMAGRPWEMAMGFPEGGVEPAALLPPLEEAFLQVFLDHAWQVLGGDWQAHPEALAELQAHPWEGCPALGKLFARQFLKALPAGPVTEAQFWETYAVFALRICHAFQSDDMFNAYMHARTVLFRSGRRCAYPRVPYPVFVGFLRAASKGRCFNASIRGRFS